jgi:hypothetical protein
MKGASMKTSTILRVFLCFLFPFILIGCSSGGGGGGGGKADEVVSPLLSTTSAYPGEFITIKHDSIKAAQESTIEFSAAGGYIVTLKINPQSDGTVRAGIPLYLDPVKGMNATGSVTVKVNGNPASGAFIINAIPELGTEAGEVYALFLEKIIAEFEKAKGHLSDISKKESMDFVSNAADTLAAKIAQYQAMINQIRTTRTLTVSPQKGVTRTLDAQELEQLDKWLAFWVLGLEAEMLGVAPLSGEAINMDDWLTISAEERLRRVQGGIDYVIDETKRGVKAGVMWLSGMSLVMTASGYAVAVEVGSDIAGAGGLAITYIQATYELGAAAIIDKMCEAFSSESREAYDWTAGLLEQGSEILLEGLSNIKGEMGAFFEGISTGNDVYKVIVGAEEAKCGGQSGSYQVAAAPFSGITITDFCGNEVVLSDTLVAHVSIQDYSASFTFTEALATLGTTEDGQGNILLGDIPSIIGTDGELYLNNFGALVNQDTLMIMFHPDLAGPFPRTIDITDIWLEEGGEAEFTYHTPYFLNEGNPNDPVIFTAVGGSITVEHYGTVVGGLLKGTFSVNVEGDRDISQDESEVLTGTITGSFEGVISKPPGS